MLRYYLSFVLFIELILRWLIMYDIGNTLP